MEMSSTSLKRQRIGPRGPLVCPGAALGALLWIAIVCLLWFGLAISFSSPDGRDSVLNALLTSAEGATLSVLQAMLAINLLFIAFVCVSFFRPRRSQRPRHRLFEFFALVVASILLLALQLALLKIRETPPSRSSAASHRLVARTSRTAALAPANQTGSADATRRFAPGAAADP